MTTRAHNPRLRVRYSAVLGELRQSGGVRETQIGALPISLVDAGQYVAAYEAGVARGIVTYELMPDAPASQNT
jgi:hypothetical protein